MKAYDHTNRNSAERLGKGMSKRFLAAAVTVAAVVLLVVVLFFLLREPIIERLYPIEYEPLVEQYAQDNGIDPILVYAVIYTESRFQPNAESNIGARGLMQITEETFDWVKYRLDDPEDLTFDKMYDPETNIRYGTYLLGYLNKEFKNQKSILCAYHAGINIVKKWMSSKEYSLNGVDLDKIPYKDTAHYVDKVEKAINIYSERIQ